MKDVIITIGGTDYRCVPFYNADKSLTGVDVYLNETYWDRANSSFLGEIEDIELPDEEDEESVAHFTDQVEDWLNGK
jgi:hypothetical protein